METETMNCESGTEFGRLEDSHRWFDLGVELSPYPKDWLRERIHHCGEIKVLLAIMTSLGARPLVKEDSKQVRQNKLVHIDRALSKTHIGPNAMKRLNELTQRPPIRFPIPWIHRYLHEVTPDDLDLIEHLVAIPTADDSLAKRLFAANGPEWLKLSEAGLVQPKLQLHDDFQPATVVTWLEFLVNGHNDSTLGPAFERYRPDKLKDHGAFVAAYEQLFGAESTKSISH